MTNPKEAKDYQWKELFSLATKFCHFHDGHKFASGASPVWERKFLEKMAETAETSANWFWVATAAEPFSPHWKNALQQLLNRARDATNSIYHWNRVLEIAPEGHSFEAEAILNIRSIRTEKRNKKKEQ
ncbi:MAG: hypothetical protein ACD_15C00151G0001 [uncultured bacterium]|nr:MAG: hypothetical protein ACD_15C00151G0001 [uncultured bacterium]